MHATQPDRQADARLFILVSGFSQCILYGLTRALRVLSQNLDFEFSVVDGDRLAKRVKEVEKACLNRRLSTQVFLKQQWNLRVLQRGKDRLKFRFAASPPHSRYSLLIRLLLGPNQRQVAVAALREANAKFGFAQGAIHDA